MATTIKKQRASTDTKALPTDPMKNLVHLLRQQSHDQWHCWAEEQADPQAALQLMSAAYSKYSKYLESYFGSRIESFPRPD